MNMRRAFTLIELLTVIAIIALLAAILFPVFARAKKAARQSQCISNMKQIGTAIGIYMADYDGLFPFAVDAADKFAPEIWDGQPEWQAFIDSMPMVHEVLQPQAKNLDIFSCPLDMGTHVLDNNFPLEFETSPSLFKAHGMSYFYRTAIAFQRRSDSDLSDPAAINVMFDANGNWHGDGRALRVDDPPSVFAELTSRYRYTTVFADFHAKSLHYDKMAQAWDTPL